MRSLQLLLWSMLLWVQQTRAQDQTPIVTDRDDSNVGNAWKYNFSSPAPHIFSSVNGLLQQWSNTFFPIGHSIVPCHIPPYTNLYHGRQDGEMPESPEWVAFDVEMSYGIMGSARNSHILTYQTTKQTGCLYFDGESATLFGSGMMDAQMLFIYGNATGPPVDDGRRFRGLEDEYNRASGLCQWVKDKGLGGLGWGVEGIVRMNAGFEMIWCNFTSPSARLLTKTNVTAPLLRDVDEHAVSDDDELVARREKTDRGPAQEHTNTSPEYYPLPTDTSPPDRSTGPDQPPMPPSWRQSGQEPFLASQTWGWFESATWHYGSSGMGAGRGESRVKPLTCGFLTFYDSIFYEQHLERAIIERKKLNLTTDGHWMGPGMQRDRKVALERLIRRKRYHSLRNISAADARLMNDASERVLRSLDFENSDNTKAGHFTNNCTGTDWTAVTNDIVQRYAPRLQQMNTIFDRRSNIDMKNSIAVRSWIMGLRQHTHFLLMPYYEYPTEPSSKANQDEFSITSTKGQQTLSRCQYQYTRLLAPDLITIALNPEEALIMSSVEETLGSICLWVIDAGLAIEREWLDHFDGHISSHPASLINNITSWQNGLEELMAWLGWVDQWTYCKDGCAQDEVCFIPMWPMDNIDQPGRRFGPGPGGKPGYGYGYGPPGRTYPGHGDKNDVPEGRPGEHPRGPPNWFTNEDSLWQPKCIKTEYAM